MEIQSLDNFDAVFNPRSICIAGISRKANSLGRKVLRNLLNSGYQGRIFPLNPRADEIEGLKAYSSLKDLPETPDMVISLVKRDTVLPLAEQCASLGVRALVIITAGFRESGDEGLALERKIGEVTHTKGVRIVGPNTMGVINTARGIHMDASFTPVPPHAGKLSVISQSGALGAVITEYCNEEGVGISKFVSVGNKLDINENHLIKYYGEDEDTDVILCYLESFVNTTDFREEVLRVSHKKPVLVVKSGSTEQGSRAAASHTGALASDDKIAEAFLKNIGAIRCKTVREMVGTAKILAAKNQFFGSRVAIVSNAGGPGTLTTDYAVQVGLEIATLSESSRTNLAAVLPPEATVSNPVDILPSATPDTYVEVTRTLLDDPNVDGVIVLILPPVLMDLRELISKLDSLYISSDKPFLAVLMGCESFVRVPVSVSFPSFFYPEFAMQCLSNSVRYRRWVSRRKDARLPAANAPGGGSLPTIDSEGMVEQSTLTELLESYEIHTPSATIVNSREELLEACHNLGFPVVIKLASKTLSHKSEHGGIFLNVSSTETASQAFDSILTIYSSNKVPEDDRGVLVQELIEDAVEVVVGVVKDPVFGHAIMVGSGGTLVELMKDISFLPIPFSEETMEEELRNLKVYQLLTGYRGGNVADLESLHKLIMNVQRLILDHPEITELDMNPVMCTASGCTAVDVRAVVIPA